MNQIHENDLQIKVQSPSGNVLTYGFEIKNLVGNEKHAELVAANNELRQLFRATENLRECEQLLRELTLRREGSNIHAKNDHNGHRSRFAMATILYGACFVRGEDRKKAPLHDFEKELSCDPWHKSILTYRHKLFSHLDADHEVRTDILIFQMRISGNELQAPATPNLTTNQHLLPGTLEIEEWRNLIANIISMMSKRKAELTEKINLIIGNIKILKANDN